MSLLDAILSEPYRDPREVWIAVRSDGQRGSGTIDDPFDGGTRPGTALLAGLTCRRREFVAGTRSPHGLLASDVGVAAITIKNVRGPGMAWFNHTFQLKAILSPLHLLLEFAATPPGVPPAGPATEASGFDYITVEYPSHTGGPSPVSTIAAVYWPVASVTAATPHGLAPFGAVRLTGFGAPFDGDQFAVGSDVFGIPSRTFYFQFPAPLPNDDVTSSISGVATALIHRFDEVMRTVPEYSVVHLAPGTYETRGAGNIYATAEGQVYVGFLVQRGQKIRGSGLRGTTLKLVLPVDGLNMTAVLSRFTTFPVPFVDGFEASDLTIDCNASGHVAPYGAFPAQVTCGAVAVYASFARIRRVRAINYCTQANAECFVISIAGGVMNVIEDCIVEEPGLNNLHETTMIYVSGDRYANARASFTRHNYADGTFVRAGVSGVTRVSSEVVSIASITQESSPELELFRLVTKRPHGRDTSNNVRLNNVSKLNGFPHPVLNGSFPVEQYVSPTELIFRVVGTAVTVDVALISSAYLGVDFHAAAALGGTGCVVEGNSVFACHQGLYTDTGSTRDVVVRDNYWSQITYGLNFDFNPNGPGGKEETPRFALNLTRDNGNPKLAILETPQAHQLRVGDAVEIDGARIGGDFVPAGTYNGNYAVASVLSPTKFAYLMKNDPGADADAATSGLPISLQSRWQVRRMLLENNAYDLYTYDVNSALAPRAVSTFGYQQGPPYMFLDAVVRENAIRMFAKALPSLALAPEARLGLRLDSSVNGLIENNLIDVPDANPVHHINSGTMNAFNNRTPSGTPLPLDDLSASTKKDVLEDRIADALALSMI